MGLGRTAVFVAGALLVSAGIAAALPTDSLTGADPFAIEPRPTAPPLLRIGDFDQLFGSDLEPVEADEPAPATITELDISDSVSIAVADVESGASVSVGDGQFTTASVVKVALVAALWVSSGGELSSTEQALAESAITVSDNAATTQLLRTVGGSAGLNNFFAEWGLSNTQAPDGLEWGLTRTTAHDQLAMLRLIFEPNAVIDDAGRAYISDLMTRVVDEQRLGVTAAASDPELAALKAGYLQDSDTGQWHVGSIGRIYVNDEALLVAVLSTGSASYDDGVALIEDAVLKAVESIR